MNQAVTGTKCFKKLFFIIICNLLTDIKRPEEEAQVGEWTECENE